MNVSSQSNLIGKDAILKRKEFEEVARLLGMPGCTYQYFMEGTKKYSIHGEVEGVYSKPEPIPLIFLEVPDQETATTYGWVSVLDNDKPYLCQVPYDTKHLENGCRITIPFVGDSRVDDETGPAKVFRVTRVYMMSRFPNCRMVQLAPEVESKLITDIADEYPDSNYNYLKVDQNS